jgi:hypothetical protein
MKANESRDKVNRSSRELLGARRLSKKAKFLLKLRLAAEWLIG